jgi:two-component system OmpR family sensor kinase
VIVEGVQDHLRQAIANLVFNALTHTPAGTPLEVSARATGNRAELVIRDHGQGLSSDALQHAFDRFWRADPSRVGPKAGLGLSIVAAIAESHGGTATARNHPDGGAVFTLDLPLTTAVSGSARPTET